MIRSGIAVEMPGGVWRNGARRRDARLRVLNGDEAGALIDHAGTAVPVVFGTRLLARSLVEIAGETQASEEIVRELTIGDREALLLHLQRIAYGDRIDLTVACPSCRVRLDVSVNSTDLLVAPYRSARAVWGRSLVIDRQRSRVRFRLPNGRDLEAAIRIEDEGSAAASIVARCVLAIDPPCDFGALVPSMDRLMAELDPQAELRFNLRCPECEMAFSAVLDMAKLLMQEVAAQARAAFGEIHAIASAYHWSESDILALTPARRRRYLDLIGAYGAAG